jgi:hypothetical protein
MDVTWRKVWRDLWRNKARTVLVVLATAAGVGSLGMTFGMAGLMRQKMVESHRATVMAHLRFWTTSVFEQDVLETIARDPEIADVEAVAVGEFRWQMEGEDKWRFAELEARPDYEGQRMNRTELLEGNWPTGRALVAERLSANFYDIGPGTTVIVDFGQRERRLPVSGVARGQMVLPPQFSDIATFYVTPETLAWLTGQPEGYNGLFAQLESFSQEGAEEAAQRIGRRLELMGLARTDEGYLADGRDEGRRRDLLARGPHLPGDGAGLWRTGGFTGRAALGLCRLCHIGLVARSVQRAFRVFRDRAICLASPGRRGTSCASVGGPSTGGCGRAYNSAQGD